MVIQARSRQQIREAIGRNLGVEFITAQSGDTTSFITNGLFGDADDYNGWWWLGTGPSSNDGTLARVVDTAVSGTYDIDLTVHPAVTSVSNNDTAELWPPRYNPRDIEDYINQAILEVTGIVYDPEEDITLHGGHSRYSVPNTLDIISKVMYRSYSRSETVIERGTVYDESVGGIFTVTQDDEDKLFGRVCTKFVVSGAGDGQIASEAISSLDLSGYTHIEFPIKVNVAVAASDLVLRLSATANGADTDKIIAIPAISVGTDTWVRVAMDEATSSFTAAECTAIISVALEYNANSAANTIWLGEIRATDDRDEEWSTLSSHNWRTEPESRELVLLHGGDSVIGYSLIKLLGGDKPALLTADGTASEVDDWFLIARATHRALASTLHRAVDQAGHRQNMGIWAAEAENAKRRMGSLIKGRVVG